MKRILGFILLLCPAILSGQLTYPVVRPVVDTIVQLVSGGGPSTQGGSSPAVDNSLIAQWLFENDTVDEAGNYDFVNVGEDGRDGIDLSYQTIYFEGDYAADITLYESGNTVEAVDVGNEFTIVYMIYNNSVPALAQYIVTNLDADNNGWACIMIDDLSFGFLTGNGVTVDTAFTVPGLVSLMKHVAVVVDRTLGEATIYVDGVDQTDSINILTDFRTSDTLYIGATYDRGHDHHLSAMLDEVSIYKRKLTSSEIVYLRDHASAVIDTTLTSEEPTISGCPISHNQYYIVPENAVNGDYVGQWHYNPVDSLFNSTHTSWSYSITAGNTGTAFAIDANGLITIVDATAVTALADPEFTLTIQTTSGGDSENNYAYINVTDIDSSKYIDMDIGSGGAGTLGDPWGTIDSVDFRIISGYAYYLKRGSTTEIQDEIHVTTVGTPGKPNLIGAYGQGALPIIDSAGAEGAIVLGTYPHNGDASYCYVYDIMITGGNMVLIRDSAIDVQFHRMDVSGTVVDGAIAFQGLPEYGSVSSKIYDCKLTNLQSHAIKAHGGADIRGCELYDVAHNGASMHNGLNSIKYSYVRGIPSQYGIEISGAHDTVEFCFVDSCYDGVTFAWGSVPIEHNDHSVLRKSIIQNIVSRGVRIGEGNDVKEFHDHCIIEDNIIRNVSGAAGIYLQNQVDSLIIRRNHIYDNANCGIRFGNFNVYENNTFISYNVIRDNDGIGLYMWGNNIDTVFCDNNLIIYNNGRMGTNTDVDALKGYLYFRNNIYERQVANTIDSLLTNSSGLSILNNVYTNDFTINSSHRNASLLIDAGTDLDYTKDILGNPVGANPDIGPYEKQ